MARPKKLKIPQLKERKLPTVKEKRQEMFEAAKRGEKLKIYTGGRH